MGAITPIGNSVQEFWDNAVAGKSGLDILQAFDHSAYPVHIAGEVKGFDPEEYMDRRVARRMARFSQFAMAGTAQALRHADLNLEDTDRDRVGVLMGNGIGGLEESQKGVRTIASRGGMRLDPFYFPKMLPNMAAAHVALNFGARGYNNTVITACAAGTQAIGDAMDLVRAGRVDVCIAGGSEASLCELGLSGFAVIRSLSLNNDEPQKASRPFDAERDGFVAAEGAGIMILESEEHAKSRNAPVLAEVAGYGACSDAYHVVAPSADGNGAMRAMREALEDAHVEPSEVDYINAHVGSRLHQRSRHVDAAERQVGDAGDQDAFRRGRLPGADQRHEVDGRPLLWRCRRCRIGGGGADYREQSHPPDDQPRAPGSGVRPGLRARGRA